MVVEVGIDRVEGSSTFVAGVVRGAGQGAVVEGAAGVVRGVGAAGVGDVVYSPARDLSSDYLGYLQIHLGH